ncbi:TolC family protein [Candidatus Synchoanobacter obligatus]|uniref:TolC family protein n=1 Tax=Candidatus Synchoanobacter obligatus TaxID=2919597 RepID=A0ABT1L4X3_9GAMM|nr:TolC family protein [Candidatus Synchoanobacter obligatus]MCP8351918.1 TolC family protein [Candidatus Synchoanobacter obligatus]
METNKIARLILLPLLHVSTLGSPQSLSLDDAVEQYKTHNPEIHHIQKQLLITEQKIAQSNKPYSPSPKPIEINVAPFEDKAVISTGIRADLPTGGQLEAHYRSTLDDHDQYSIKIHQPITQNIAKIERAIQLIDQEIQQLQYRDNYQDKILQFKKRYRQIVLQQRMVEDKKQQLDILTSHSKEQDVRYKYGEISKSELNISQTALEEQRLNTLKDEQLLEMAMITLKVEMFININKIIVLDTDIHFTNNIPTPSETINQAVRLNTQSQIAKLQYQRAKYQKKIFEKKQRPALSLYGSIDQDQKTSAGISLKFNLPTQTDQFERNLQTLQYQQSAMQAYHANNTLRTTIHQTLINLQHQQALISVAADHLKHQQQKYAADSIKFKYHHISAEEFQQSSQKVNSAYQQALGAQISYCNLYEDLQKMTGQFEPLINTQDNTHA